MSRIHAQSRSVGELLSPSYHFHPPEYQRPYSWTEQEAGQLLGDLLVAMGEHDAWHRQIPPYFLGAIVIIKKSFQPNAQLVDGQQRMLTLAILLCVLRDMDKQTQGRVSPHLIHGQDSYGRMIYSIAPRPSDKDFFEGNILRLGAAAELDVDVEVKNEAQTNMLCNALYLRRALSELSLAKRLTLAEYVLDNVYLAEISTPGEAQGHHIFQVVNSRGLELEDCDVLKSELLANIAPERRTLYSDKWEALEAKLERRNFIRLFGYIRTIHLRRKAQRAQFIEIRQHLNPTANPEDFIDNELIPKGEVLHDILKCDMSMVQHRDEINALLRVLSRIDHNDWIGVAISFFSFRRRRGDEALKFLRALERMAYAFFIRNQQEYERLKRYRDLYEMIARDAKLEELLDRMALTQSEKTKVLQVLDGAIYKNRRVCRPIMLRIDESLADSGARYDLRVVTVEHVLPQNPPAESEWREVFTDNKERRRLTDKLGNLALLSTQKNVKAGNLDFDRKKQEYFIAHGVTRFAITTQILSESRWTPEVIRRRHELLLNKACEIWGL